MYKDAPIGLCHFDTGLRYRHVNDWLAALSGIPPDEHLGRTIGEILPNVAAGVELKLRHVLETGEPVVRGLVQAEVPAEPGVTRTFEHNYYAVRSADGTIMGVSCVVQDVTERVRTEAERARYESMVTVVAISWCSLTTRMRTGR
jgi:PAS domain S-box-containing protein